MRTTESNDCEHRGTLMPDDPLSNAVEAFSAPIEGLIAAVGGGIAAAQRALDENSIQMQESIDSDPVLSQYGLQATWYQFPKVDLQLKMSLTVVEDQSSSPPAAPGTAAGPAPASSTFSLLAATRAIRVVAQPVSASFQTHFNYSAEAASQVSLSIVPVPAPRSGDQVSLPPRMQLAAVQAAALASAAKFVTIKDSQGKAAPAPSDAAGNLLRLDVNYNGAGRLWYVLQYAPANNAVIPVVVAIDDTTGSVKIIRTP
jgi:hypothetical protein